MRNGEQRTEEWFKARLGLATSSRYKDVLAEGTKSSRTDIELNGVIHNFGDKAVTYAMELIAQRLTGHIPKVFSAALDWGTANEENALYAYERAHFRKVKDAPFITTILPDGSRTGGSPDGFVGVDGVIEIKCPFNDAVHLRTLITCQMPEEHIPQVQGHMLHTDAKWCDFISYDPRFPKGLQLFVKRIQRDEVYIEMLKNRLMAFNLLIERTVGQLKALYKLNHVGHED